MAAGHTSCCVSSCRTLGGCYCDFACHAARDCCPDINLTCPGIAHVLACSPLVTKTKAPMWQIIVYIFLTITEAIVVAIHRKPIMCGKNIVMQAITMLSRDACVNNTLVHYAPSISV